MFSNCKMHAEVNDRFTGEWMFHSLRAIMVDYCTLNMWSSLLLSSHSLGTDLEVSVCVQ